MLIKEYFLYPLDIGIRVDFQILFQMEFGATYTRVGHAKHRIPIYLPTIRKTINVKKKWKVLKKCENDDEVIKDCFHFGFICVYYSRL